VFEAAPHHAAFHAQAVRQVQRRAALQLRQRYAHHQRRTLRHQFKRLFPE
jgi:hypothetical protein